MKNNKSIADQYLHLNLDYQKGSSLIEVLVTMVITAISLLGFAAMQIRSQQEHKIGYLRTIATTVASSYLDVVRSNYRLSRDGLTAFSFLPLTNIPTQPVTDCAIVVCTPVQMNEFEQYQIIKKVSSSLPEGGIAVEWVDDPDPGGYNNLSHGLPATPLEIAKHPIIRITVAWKEPEVSAGASDSNCTRSAAFVTLTGYRCTFMSTAL